MSEPLRLASAPTEGRRGRRAVTLEFLAAVLVSFLAIQFLLGTYLEMFVSTPSGRDLGALSADGLVALVAHIVVGVMVLGLSFRMTYVAARARNPRGTVLAGTAALGLVVAFLGGMGFTFGTPTDALSFVMASGFFLALLATGVLLARPRLRPDDEAASLTQPPG